MNDNTSLDPTMSGDQLVDFQSGRRVTQSGGPLRFEGPLLTVARAAWVLIALASAGIFIAGIPLRYQELLVPCVDNVCANGQLTPGAMLALQNAGISTATFAAFDVFLAATLALVYGVVALIIFWRQSREWMALLVSLWLVTFGITFGDGVVLAVAASYTWLQPLASFLDALGGGVLLGLFLFLFPDGRFVPRWIRWVFVAFMAFFFIGGFGLEPFLPDFYTRLEPIFAMIWLGMILTGIGAQAYRYQRVSGPIERQQTKWVMFGLLFVVLGIVGMVVIVSINQLFIQPALEATTDYIIQRTMGTLAFLMIPLTIGFSILRYRLWDSDIIINRTLVYGLLTAVLALLYFGSIVLFQQVMQALTGQHSPLAIVASTLLIAALFSPLRFRLQSLIDRRFYRRKYDAAQTLSSFAQAAQEEVDLEHLTSRLLAAVEQTMQPEHISIWVKGSSQKQSPK